MAANKPSVLILGGCGFIGRNLVAYLVAKNVCSHIRVVDKMLPSVAFLGPAHKEAFASPIVKFKQGNAASAGMFYHLSSYKLNKNARLKVTWSILVFPDRIPVLLPNIFLNRLHFLQFPKLHH
jgi:hypothetical protein